MAACSAGTRCHSGDPSIGCLCRGVAGRGGSPEGQSLAKCPGHIHFIRSRSVQQSSDIHHGGCGQGRDRDSPVHGDAETLITDPALRVEEVCTYLNGTELKESCVRAGEKTTYVYDYRHRLVETKTQPRVGKTLSSKQVYIDNKLFSSEDPYGRKTFYAYNTSDARLIRTNQATIPSVTYANFAAVTAATRAPASTANPTSLITDYTLNSEGQTTATIDPLGNTHTVLFDSRGRAIEQVAASGTAVASKTKTIYDLASRPIEVQSPRYFDATDTTGLNKARSTMTYTGRGLLLTRTESPGTPEVATETYTYNIEGNPLTRVDARSQTWTTVWNTCCGRKQAAFDPYGHGTIVNVDNLGRAAHTATVSNVTAHSGNYKDPLDAQTLGEVTTKYDSRGRVSARTVWLTPLGPVDPNAPPIYTGPPVNDSANPPAAPYGLTTNYAYDDNLADAVGLSSTFSAHLAGLSLGANSDGSAVLVTNPAGERSLSIKDGLGRTVRSVQLDIANAALVSNTSTFDTMVNIATYGDVLETASANALGHTNRSRTDGAGRTMQSLDPANAITAFTYDAGGRRLSIRDPNTVGQNCTYDALGRDLVCTDTAAAVTSKTYDLSGNMKTQTDAKGKLTTLVYDSRNRRTTLTDRIAATTTWTHDAAGNELTMTDAENQTTVYGYDNSGRRITTQWPDHVAGQNPGQLNCGILSAAYREDNKLLRTTNQLGDTIAQVYDLGGRLLRKEFRTLANSPSGTLSSQDTYTYDAASRLLTAASGEYANTVGRTYSYGRLASESLTTDGQTYTTSLAYDFTVPKVTLTYPNGMTASRSLNSRGLLASMQMGSTTLLSRTYDVGRRLTGQTFGNGIVEAMSYRNDNLPNTRNTPVGNYTFGWDANKNKTSEAITGTLSGYGWSTGTTGFDDQNRLTARNQGSGATQLNEAFTLTPVADMSSTTTNGVAQARTHGPAHEMLSIGGTAVVEDTRGNITNDGLGNTFAWDKHNHLSTAETNNDNIADVSYTYDALRRRVKKTTTGANGYSMIFISVCHDVVADYTAGTAAITPLRNYLYTGRIDEPVAMIDYTTAGSLAAGIAELFYYHLDANWHVRGLTTSTGTATEAYTYSSYGTPTILNPSNGTVRTTSLIGNRWMFTAREWDQETKTYHFRLRTFGAFLQSFLARDPLRYVDGPNTYHSPFIPKGADPFGLLECDCKPSDCAGLPPINSAINDHVNDSISNGLAPRDGMCNGWGSLCRVRDGIASDNGAAVASQTQIEIYLQNLGRTQPNTFLPFSRIPSAGCMTIDCFGVRKCIGTDKMGHMFQQGFMLFQLYQDAGLEAALAFSHFTEGLPVRGDQLNWLNSDNFDFYGFDENRLLQYRGIWGGGPIAASPQDHDANVSGMVFYNDLYNNMSRGRPTNFNICDYVGSFGVTPRDRWNRPGRGSDMIITPGGWGWQHEAF